MLFSKVMDRLRTNPSSPRIEKFEAEYYPKSLRI
jgi:hypothetical protein